MSSPEGALQIPIQEVLNELQSMGIISNRDVQMATARVSARVLQDQVQELSRELDVLRAENDRK